MCMGEWVYMCILNFVSSPHRRLNRRAKLVRIPMRLLLARYYTDRMQCQIQVFKYACDFRFRYSVHRIQCTRRAINGICPRQLVSEAILSRTSLHLVKYSSEELYGEYSYTKRNCNWILIADPSSFISF